MKLQCIGDICAPPIIRPRQPASSISFQADVPSGFLKVEPPVFSRIGCTVSRWFARHPSRLDLGALSSA
jgi:hypothetical protein